HLALPLLPEALVVGERGLDRVRDHAGAPLGPQVEVDAVAEAALERRLEPRLQVPHHARDLLVARELASGGRRVGEEQVDVRQQVELASAELAEREQRRRRRAVLLRTGAEGGGEAAGGVVYEIWET